MKVEVRISADVREPHVVIHANALTPDIARLVAAIDASDDILTVADADRVIVLRTEEIYMIRIEEDRAAVYDKSRRYVCNRRLYELEERLGSGFLRISKSTLVNLRQIESVQASYQGLMLLLLKNGCKDYVSRRYLPGLKAYLGL